MTRILVIEDEAPLREEIVAMLDFEGFLVLSAPDGRVGVELAEHEQPDLIICDIAMPELDGYEVLVTLRENPMTAMIPFIFLTARADRSFRRHGMELGADDYLTKPFTSSELLAAVSVRLERHAAAKQLNSQELQRTKQKITRLITHELRTPMASIKMIQDIMSRQINQMPLSQMQELLDTLRTGSQRLNHAIEQTVLITQLETGELSPETVVADGMVSPLREILTAAINLARNFAFRRQGATVRLDDGDQNPSISCYLPALKQGLAELITNALNFSPDGGEVVISYWQAEDAIRVRIVDHGPGMPPEQVEQTLEELFHQIDRETQEQQGLGLGLPLARRVIEIHGGTLELNSVVDQGTQVVVRLPLPNDHPAPRQNASRHHTLSEDTNYD